MKKNDKHLKACAAIIKAYRAGKITDSHIKRVHEARFPGVKWKTMSDLEKYLVKQLLILQLEHEDLKLMVERWSSIRN